MGDAGRRLRARRTQRLVARFAAAGCGLAAGAIAGWALGLTVSVTVAILCIGMPASALFLHLASVTPCRWRTEDRARRFPIPPRHGLGKGLVRRRAS